MLDSIKNSIAILVVGISLPANAVEKKSADKVINNPAVSHTIFFPTADELPVNGTAGTVSDQIQEIQASRWVTQDAPKLPTEQNTNTLKPRITAGCTDSSGTTHQSTDGGYNHCLSEYTNSRSAKKDESGSKNNSSSVGAGFSFKFGE